MTTHFLEMLKRAEEIHQKKNQDYTTNIDANPYENFDRSNDIARWFPDNYKSFAVLIGVKLARIGALLTQKRKPNNESLDDSFLDLVVYCILFYCFWKDRLEESCKHTTLNRFRICESCHAHLAEVNVTQETYTWSMLHEQFTLREGTRE
jgi:hypothetical protein